MVRVLLLSLMLLTPSAAIAVDRTQVVEDPELVTPLLNGQFVPDVVLQDAQGKDVNLRQLVEQRPSVVLFYRGGWCPYCNRQLKGLVEVEQRIIDLGYQIIAISPDTPERLAEQKTDKEFKVIRLSDSGLQAIRGFGIGYFLAEDVAKMYRNKLGALLSTLDGTERVVLPVPAAFVVDDTGLIRFQYVNPNYKVRVDPQLLFYAAKLSR